ncbi:MAG TPA: hypothetical protein DCW60_01265 [Sutterella sp.]|nr:hypothetical protein [Sutterella sp.]
MKYRILFCALIAATLTACGSNRLPPAQQARCYAERLPAANESVTDVKFICRELNREATLDELDDAGFYLEELAFIDAPGTLSTKTILITIRKNP